MRIAAIYDIHANLPALEAVLEDVREAQVDALLIGGDVLPGPMPYETMAYLLNLAIPLHFIEGNGDREVLAAMRGEEGGALPEQAREAVRWCAGQLPPEYIEILASWPKTVRLEVNALGETLFCHATPKSDTDIFTHRTSEERLLRLFEGLNSPAVVVCGHTHMQFDRTAGGIRILNAGSVGMPFGEPGAYWLLLGPDAQFRRTEYDLGSAARRIRNTKYPQAEEFAASNILHAPSEAQMLELFSRAESHDV